MFLKLVILIWRNLSEGPGERVNPAVTRDSI